MEMEVMTCNGCVISPVPATLRTQRSAKLVFLTLNDVYELLPNADGQGGVAEFKTLLEETRKAVQSEHLNATILVTLNGDFLWRSEFDRRDKGPLMMEVLHCLGIEFVVMGNHEFDHSALYLQELLRNASFQSFGSNIRSTADGSIMEQLVDTAIIPLANGLKLGMFGVCTTETGKDPFAGPEVRFEDVVDHAKRCAASLKESGADVIVALTHLKMRDDKQLVRQVPDITLVLGGHDHEPTTEFVGSTMIHKSGQDALWLGKIQLNITKIDSHGEQSLGRAPTVNYSWQMLYNRGYTPDPATRAAVLKYLETVEADDRANGKLVPLARSLTALDGTRFTCRQSESNFGHLIADAMRVVLDADVAVIHAGLIKGDLLNPPGLELTPRWLERTLPQPRRTVVVQLRANILKDALQHMLRRFPAMSSSMPQVSGIQVDYRISDPSAGNTIRSLRLDSELEQELVATDRLLRVALPVVVSMDGWREYFAPATACARVRDGSIVRDVVALYLTRHARNGTVAYSRSERRIRIVEREYSR